MTTTTTTTANNVSKATTRPVIDREGRESYAYILNVNGTPTKTLARGWWSTREGMMLQKAAMATAARAFKKTAAVLVYRLHDDGTFHFCDSCQTTSRDVILPNFAQNADPVWIYQTW